MPFPDQRDLLEQWQVDIDIRRYLMAHGMLSRLTIVLPQSWETKDGKQL